MIESISSGHYGWLHARLQPPGAVRASIEHPTARTPLLLWTLLLWLLAVGCTSRHTFHGTLVDPPQPVYDMAGTNWDGQPFRLSEHRGKVVLLFFGYTYCPDVCPLTFSELAKMYGDLGIKAQQVEVVFVSVDPERDTVSQLAVYVPAFHPDFYGLHIEEGRWLETTKKAFGVYGEKRFLEENDSPDSYFVDHTAYIYLIDRAGQLREVFPFDAEAEGMRADVEHLLRR